MLIVPYEPRHYEALTIQAAQMTMGPLSDEQRLALGTHGPSYSILDGERTLFCGGAVELWPGRAFVWAVLSGAIGTQFPGVHRAVLRFLEAVPYRRLETAVRSDFAEGQRWARMLAFTCETPGGMLAYGPDGLSYDLYARVR